MAASDVASSAPPATADTTKVSKKRPAKSDSDGEPKEKKPRQYKRLTKAEMMQIARDAGFNMSTVAKVLLASPELVVDRAMASACLANSMDLSRARGAKTVKDKDVALVLKFAGVDPADIDAVIQDYHDKAAEKAAEKANKAEDA